MPTINWRPGPGQGAPEIELYAGDRYLIAVEVYNPRDFLKVQWSFSVVTVTESGLEENGCPCDWVWGDVEWYIPERELVPSRDNA